MRVKFKSLGVILSMLIMALPSMGMAERLPRMLITEVKTGGVVAGQPTEFVEIMNDSTQNINLSGWAIEYAKPAAKISDCSAMGWKLQDSSANVKEYPISGELIAGQKLIIEIAMNDNIGGSLRLSKAGFVYDQVGWGNTISQGVCSEGELAPLPVNAKSIRRVITKDGLLVDTENNKNDFTDSDENIVDYKLVVPQNPQPDLCNNIDGIQVIVPPGYFANNGNCKQKIEAKTSNCTGVILTEILPNPAGEDTGNEYIELNNTTSQSIELVGCSLKVGSTAKQLSGVMLPGYQVFYGVVLPNTAGGMVELITSTNEEAVTYPINLKDNQAWALINGQWQLTEKPTPGAENVAYTVVEEVSVTQSSITTYEPCPEGKYRNPETNRCKTIEATEGQKPCESGQIRNPETNRCKKTAEVLTSLKPCEAGQTRNPATNRCRKVAIATALASCKEGQERNPDTNRCRKVAALATSSPSNQLEQEVKSKQNISYGIFGAMAILVLGYGLYEYRGNITNFFARHKK